MTVTNQGTYPPCTNCGRRHVMTNSNVCPSDSDTDPLAICIEALLRIARCSDVHSHIAADALRQLGRQP
jgi:hypothetical protein